MSPYVLSKIKKIIESDADFGTGCSDVKSKRILGLFISILQSRLDDLEDPETWHPESAGLESTIMFLKGLDWNDPEILETLNQFDLDVEKKTS